MYFSKNSTEISFHVVEDHQISVTQSNPCDDAMSLSRITSTWRNRVIESHCSINAAASRAVMRCGAHVNEKLNEKWPQKLQTNVGENASCDDNNNDDDETQYFLSKIWCVAAWKNSLSVGLINLRLRNAWCSTVLWCKAFYQLSRLQRTRCRDTHFL